MIINVRDMINLLLQQVEQDESIFDMPVLIAGDAEGNRISHYCGFSICNAVQDERAKWWWDLVSDEDDESIPDNAVKAVVLWPTN